MLKKDRWRLIIVAVVVLAALLSVFPIEGEGSPWTGPQGRGPYPAPG